MSDYYKVQALYPDKEIKVKDLAVGDKFTYKYMTKFTRRWSESLMIVNKIVERGVVAEIIRIHDGKVSRHGHSTLIEHSNEDRHILYRL